MTAPRIRIDRLVIAGLDQASVQPERLRTLLARALAQHVDGTAPLPSCPTSGEGLALTVRAAPGDMRAVARGAAAAILGAARAGGRGRS